MIDVVWTISELEQFSAQDRPGVLIDVLRASTTMTTAIHNGARAVVPAASIEEALRIGNSIGRDNVLLCGERQGVRIEGFDLGNSPSEFTAGVIRQRTIVMTTTNGTRALKLLSGASPVFIGAFVNLRAVARELSRAERDPLIVCAGLDGRVSVDDALCAGMLIERCLKKRSKRAGAPELGDGAIAALALARQQGTVSVDFLRDTAAGQALERVGLGEDLALCAKVDSILEVPILRDSQITRLELAEQTADGVKRK
ncbi:MAG: 2-phosphosulfolactate phosphatase [Gemmatimonadota bacterium]|nr:2-phosphosulfolactate phosphatase [Candidatus Palauibacterales bacterium]